MVHLQSDLASTDLLTISTGGGAVAPRDPLTELTINWASLIIAVALSFHQLVFDAGLTWQRIIKVTLSTTMLWRHLVCPCGNLGTSTT
jgi:hypothetical protein